MKPENKRPNVLSLRIVAAFAVVFGILTIVSGGSVLFGGADIKALAGATVAFVLWFNFLSGFVYVLAGIGIARRTDWAFRLSVGLVVLIAIVFLLLGLHILQGGAFELRTVIAMLFRLAVWALISLVLFADIRTRQNAK